MESMGKINPSTLSTTDLPWQIVWSKEKCTLCGRCTAVCPVRAIELGVHSKRTLQVPMGLTEKPGRLVQRLSWDPPADRTGLRLHRLRDVRSGLPQPGDQAGS